MWRLLPLLLIAACSPLRGCVESRFEMAPDSRIPHWFSLPPSAMHSARSTYYTRDDAQVEFFADGKKIAEVFGQSCWHPVMESRRADNGSFTTGTGPNYTYIRAKGILEVIEHSGGPVFRISDDPALISAAVSAKRCIHQ
jgi:hypothetical protein